MKTQSKRRPIQKLARRKQRHIGRKPDSIVVKAPQQLQPWIVSPDEVTILKNAICKGASDEEMKYCLTVARRYQLDPFQQQIWFVPRWDSKAVASDGKEGATVYAPTVGINGLLHIAARDHADFGSFSEPEFGPMVEIAWYDSYNKKSGKIKAPEWCRIEARKKGCSEPTVAKVWWEEIYPDVGRSPLVRRMPRLMLAKCAKAQATRTAYPKTGGLLIHEETQTREFQDITPGRRVIEHVDEAEQRYLEREAEALKKLTGPQREVVERKMAEAKNVTPTDIKQMDRDQADAQRSIGVTVKSAPMTYRHEEQRGHYVIDGPGPLKHAHKQELLPHWHEQEQAIIVGDEGLNELQAYFEREKVPFVRVK